MLVVVLLVGGWCGRWVGGWVASMVGRVDSGGSCGRDGTGRDGGGLVCSLTFRVSMSFSLCFFVSSYNRKKQVGKLKLK